MSARVKRVPAASFDTRMVGLEIEFFVPGVTEQWSVRETPSVHAPVTGYPAAKGIPWLEIDRETVVGGRWGYEAAALVPLNTVRDRARVMVGAIRDLNGVIDRDCGLHVHVDCRPGSGIRREIVCRRLFAAQDALFRLCSPYRREGAGGNCARVGTSDSDYWGRGYTCGDRVLYMSKGNAFWMSDKYPTVEVRMKEATLDPDEIADWVARVHDAALTENV